MPIFLSDFFQGFTATALGLMIVSFLTISLPLIGDMSRLKGIARRGEGHLHFLILIGNLVHELQKERGLSAAFIATPELADTDLEVQRKKALHLQTAWHNQVESLTLVGKAAAAREQVIMDLSALAQIRGQVTNRHLSPQQAVAGFSATIAGLLRLSEVLVHATARGPSTRLALGYCNLLWAKETAGIERATMTAALKCLPLSSETKTRATDLQLTQTMYLRQFKHLAPVDIEEQFDRRLAAPTSEIESCRQRIAQGDAVDARHWFELATKRINELKSIEDLLADAMLASATRFIAAAKFQTWIAQSLAGASAVAVLAILGLSGLVF